MSKFRDGPFGPTVILFAICLVITFALAGTYSATKPVIERAELEAANRVRSEVLPGADGFEVITGVQLPEGVTEAYRATNGAGYVVTAQSKGFDGPVTWIVGMDEGGEITGINMFDHSETPGLGTKVGEMAYLESYYGSVDISAIDAVTGATRTSNSLKNSLQQAMQTYELVKEA